MSYYPGNDIDLGTFAGTGEHLVLTRQDRARHCYLVGSSRTGKTKLLERIGRQDLLHFPRHRCPMVVMDAADTLYDGLTGFAAAEGLKEWPIIPFDLRRDDLIVSYDLLRTRRGIKAPVMCRAFVEAIVHAWGQTNTQETPRLASMLESVLMVAVEKECTIAQSLRMISDPQIRATLIAEVQHSVTRTTLHNAHAGGEKGFHERVESTMLRINAFLTNSILEATLCARSGQSLNMADVLEKGQILLVCLSTEGANISAADAAAVGSVLLTDLWTAAKRRGKAEEGDRIPCYVHIDEFQNYLTPDIAIGLTEASGYGLHLTLAHQYPSQLPDRGGHLGQMILNAVLATAKNKIAFQLEHPDDLDLLARVMGRQSIDLDKVKREIYQTKVMGYDLRYMPAFSEGDSDGLTESRQHGISRQTGEAVSDNWSKAKAVTISSSVTEGETETEGTSEGRTAGKNTTVADALARSTNRAHSSQDSTTDTDGINTMTGKAKSLGTASHTGSSLDESFRFGAPDVELQQSVQTYKNGDLSPAMADEFKRDQVRDYTLAQGQTMANAITSTSQESASKGEIKTHGSSHAEGDTDGVGQSVTKTKSDGTTDATTTTTTRQHSVSRQVTTGEAETDTETIGGSRTRSQLTGTSDEVGTSRSKTHNRASSIHPMLIPRMGRELSSQENESKDDQLFRLTQFLDAQPDRHCFVRLASHRRAVPIYTTTVNPPCTTSYFRRKWLTSRLKKQPFVMTAEDAQRLLTRPNCAPHAVEPTTARRRL